MRRSTTRLATLLALAALGAALLAGCGGSDAETRPAPPPKDFPTAQGKTISELLHSSGATPSKLVVAPASEVKPNDGAVAFVGPVGPELIVVSGGVVSTVIVRVPDAQPVARRKAALPSLDAFGRCGQPRRRRDCVERRAERQRQAGERTTKIG